MALCVALCVLFFATFNFKQTMARPQTAKGYPNISGTDFDGTYTHIYTYRKLGGMIHMTDFPPFYALPKHTYINFDPLKPHSYIDNWGLQGYTLFFLFLLKNINCGYSL